MSLHPSIGRRLILLTLTNFLIKTLLDLVDFRLTMVMVMAITEEKSFIAFMFRTLLTEEFGSKRSMSRELGIPLRTLQENFQCLDKAKGGTVAFERLILYCVQHHIDIRTLYLQYKYII